MARIEQMDRVKGSQQQKGGKESKNPNTQKNREATTRSFWASSNLFNPPYAVAPGKHGIMHFRIIKISAIRTSATRFVDHQSLSLANAGFDRRISVPKQGTCLLETNLDGPWLAALCSTSLFWDCHHFPAPVGRQCKAAH
jgi:hypothetical protein